MKLYVKQSSNESKITCTIAVYMHIDVVNECNEGNNNENWITTAANRGIHSGVMASGQMLTPDPPPKF